MSFIPSRLETRVVPESPYVGQSVIYRIEIDRPQDVALRVPTEIEMAPLTLNGISRTSEPLDSGLVREIVELEIGVYTIEEAEIPVIELVAVAHDGETPIVLSPVPLEVRSLVAEEGAQPREMAPPDTFWLPDYGILKAAGLGLLAALALFLVWKAVSRLRNRAKTRVLEVAPVVVRPAHEVALEALADLAKGGLLGRGEQRLFFFRLSEIMRQYVGARFEFDSLELTTTELLERLRDRPTQGLDYARFRTFSSSCDMVKFARHTPDDAECNMALTEAYSFVNETRPVEAADRSSPGEQAMSATGGGR